MARRSRFFAAFALAAGLSGAAPLAQAETEGATPQAVITNETARFVAAALGPPAAADGCVLDSLAATAGAMELRFSSPGEIRVSFTLTLDAHGGGVRLTGEPPPTLAQGCPAVAAEVDRWARGESLDRLPYDRTGDDTQVQVAPPLPSLPPAPVGATPSDPRGPSGAAGVPGVSGVSALGEQEDGRLAGAVTRVLTLVGDLASSVAARLPTAGATATRDASRVAYALFGALAVVLAVAGWRGRGHARPGTGSSSTADPSAYRSVHTGVTVVAAVAVVFAVAALARTVAPWGLVNWYAPILPASGAPSDARFGPGLFVAQSAFRAVLPWVPSTAIAANAAFGAVAVVLWTVGLLAIRLPLTAAVASGLFVALAPVHVRVSTSPEAHALAFALASLAFASWCGGAKPGRAILRMIAGLATAAAAFTRVDAWLVLGALPLFTLLDRAAPAPALARLRDAIVFWCAWLATGVAVYGLVAAPSNHPLPSASWIAAAAPRLLSQFWSAATAEPAWFPFAAVVLAPVGALWLLLRRPGLLVATCVALALAFVPLGRTIVGEGAVVGRYFLFGSAMVYLAAGAGVQALVEAALRRARWAAERTLAAAALSGLAAWIAAGSWSAYAARYGFDEEYHFLERALTAVPAGCDVVQLPVRSWRFGGDIDCCLDAPRSPLELEFHELQLRTVASGGDVRRDVDAALSGPGCIYYYETAACALASEPQVDVNYTQARAYYVEACAAARDRTMELVDETEIPPIASDRRYATSDAPARLWRLTSAPPTDGNSRSRE
ncbi:MAG: hypothetical protein H6698_06605 [Myxococcales bacterium]|nr:hypothetical protein [Myxococcales bacterium]MCB9533978.1 hypothetical protein [Myxococcales bacterium]